MSHKILGLDIETTGLLTPDHRIIEVFAGIYMGGVRKFAYDQRIDPQRGIAADAQRVHGIAYADLVGKPTWDAVAPVLIKVMEKADFYVWHNGDEFDGPFLKMEFERIGLTMPERPSLDTMQLGTWATPDGKKPRLQELCWSLGIEYDPAKAHAASYDVDVMMEAFHRGLEFGHFQLPELEGFAQAA